MVDGRARRQPSPPTRRSRSKPAHRDLRALLRRRLAGDPARAAWRSRRLRRNACKIGPDWDCWLRLILDGAAKRASSMSPSTVYRSMRQPCRNRVPSLWRPRRGSSRRTRRTETCGRRSGRALRGALRMHRSRAVAGRGAGRPLRPVPAAVAATHSGGSAASSGCRDAGRGALAARPASRAPRTDPAEERLAPGPAMSVR